MESVQSAILARRNLVYILGGVTFSLVILFFSLLALFSLDDKSESISLDSISKYGVKISLLSDSVKFEEIMQLRLASPITRISRPLEDELISGIIVRESTLDRLKTDEGLTAAVIEPITSGEIIKFEYKTVLPSSVKDAKSPSYEWWFGGPPIKAGIIEINLPPDIIEKSRLVSLARISVYADLGLSDLISGGNKPEIRILENPGLLTVQKTESGFRLFINNELSNSIDVGFRVYLPLFAF